MDLKKVNMQTNLVDFFPEIESKYEFAKLKVRGVLYNILGEHATRLQKIETVVAEQIDDILSESDKAEVSDIEKQLKKIERVKVEEIHTFPKEDGNLLVNLGGQYGLIRGAMRVAINDLYKDKVKNTKWRGYGLKSNFEYGVIVSPVWVPIGTTISNPLEQPKAFLVQTAGRSKSMITTYYDYVDKANFEVFIEIVNQKIPLDLVLELLCYIQKLGIGPKRRGRIKFTEIYLVRGNGTRTRGRDKAQSETGKNKTLLKE